MAKNDTASIITLMHQRKPKTASERGRAYRKRQREKSAVRSGKSAPSPAEPIEKYKTFANGEQPERPVRERPTAAVSVRTTDPPAAPGVRRTAKVDGRTSRRLPKRNRGRKAPAGCRVMTVTKNAEQIERLNARVEELMREIERLRNAKRRALQLADERAKEANLLRDQLASARMSIRAM